MKPYCVELSYDQFFSNQSVVGKKSSAVGFSGGATLVRAIQVALDALSMIPTMAKLIGYSFALNGEKVKENGQILGWTLVNLMMSPLQLSAYSIAIGIGLIAPKKSFSLMAQTVRASVYVKQKVGLIKQNYTHSQIRLSLEKQWVRLLLRMGEMLPDLVEMIVMPFLVEPRHSLGAGILFPLKDEAHLHNLNPTTVNHRRNPILCLHGSLHNQTAWYPLAEAFKRGDRDIFTLNLAGHEGRDEINARMKEIAKIYDSQVVSFDLIGHSWGASLASNLGSTAVESVTTLATPCPFAQLPGIDIIATLDELVDDQIVRVNPVYVRDGHLSILSSYEALKAVRSQLDNTQ